MQRTAAKSNCSHVYDMHPLDTEGAVILQRPYMHLFCLFLAVIAFVQAFFTLVPLQSKDLFGCQNLHLLGTLLSCHSRVGVLQEKPAHATSSMASAATS